MSITINLRPEVELLLLERSERRGLSVEDYLEKLVEDSGQFTSPNYITDPKERAKAFVDWANSHRHTEPLSDEAISRESMYSDHD